MQFTMERDGASACHCPGTFALFENFDGFRSWAWRKFALPEGTYRIFTSASFDESSEWVAVPPIATFTFPARLQLRTDTTEYTFVANYDDLGMGLLFPRRSISLV